MSAKPLPRSRSWSAIVSMSVDLPVPVFSDHIGVGKTVFVFDAEDPFVPAKIDASKERYRIACHMQVRVLED
jgi:hypothetical protein